jgi:S-adenosylmethionine:tRNA ribosyltransferase-isomerase
MRVEDFDFDLPAGFIAQRPVSPRDAARLLVVGEGLEDAWVRDLPARLRPGDLLVLNDTKVIPARLAGRRRPRRGGAAAEPAIEVTLHMRVGDGRWRAFARPARKLAAGDAIAFEGTLAARVVSLGAAGEVTLDFGRSDAELMAALEAEGRMPLPPYIKRTGPADARDRVDYQTAFARNPGAVAAPTAGLHFTPALLEALAARGIGTAYVTLHVGAGTFLTVRAKEVERHRMLPERGEVTAAAALAVEAARARGGRLVACGSTSLRLLETAADDGGRVRPFAGATDLFIYPGYRFKTAELLLTNFHLPRSTLFMLVCALAGRERMLKAYEHAKMAGYRFYSYGDCCLIERSEAP